MATCSCSKAGGQKKCVSRYKGIETLLRRIAFNLGNTPSQTEVKIISCIPIDVTDLQQKIISLEKQLEKTRNKKPSEDSTTSRKGKAVLPLIVNNVAYNSQGPGDTKRFPHLADALNNKRKKHKPQDFSLYLNDTQYNLKSPATDELRNVFGQIIPERDRTRLVYYAQTTSPFTYKNVPETKKEPGETMNPDYLSSIIERQHMVKMYMDDEMLGSQGSVPICRDLPPCSGTSDDMCSCCHGNFLDVDCKLRKKVVYNPNIDNGNIYYDSSYYDIKPVKEKAVKKSELGKKRTPEINFTFYPEYYRFKPEYSLNKSPKVCTTKQVKVQKRERRIKPVFLPDSSVTDGLVEFSQVYPKRLSPKQALRCNTDKPVSRTAECNILSENNTECHTSHNPIQMLSMKKLLSTSNLNESSSKNHKCIINKKSPLVQAKALQTSSLSKCGSAHACLKAALRNVSCLAIPMNESECQTEPNDAHDEPTHVEPDKTESTLNQIKTMLETVLIEVKTNSGVRTAVSEKETKDAIVQNEPVSSSECERILNSYTYSPYAMINPYMPPRSHPMPSYCSSIMRQTLTMPRQIEVPPTDIHCVQFPDMVHQPLPHSCYPDRNIQPKQTSTCATNTHEPPRKRNTETENLIKEIYKSMKLDVDFAKPASADDAKKNVSKTLAQTETGKSPLGREEMVFRGDVGTRRVMMECPSESSLNERQRRRGGSFHQAPRHTTSAQRRQCVAKGTNKETGSDTESTSEVEQPSTSPAVTPQKPAKKGFFGKVMSSMVKRMRRKEEEEPQKVEKTTTVTQDSESSDVETTVQRERPVKHVSYAPERQAWNDRPMSTSSKTRRLGQSSYRRTTDRPMHQPQRMPRYVPRSVLRPHSGSSQVRRAIYRPQAPHRPRTPPEYMKRVPHNQYEWRTTPARPSVHRMAPISTNEYKPKIPAKSPGLKITNKTWMRKPVYHLGFACGPEKEKIMMQY